MIVPIVAAFVVFCHGLPRLVYRAGRLGWRMGYGLITWTGAVRRNWRWSKAWSATSRRR